MSTVNFSIIQEPGLEFEGQFCHCLLVEWMEDEEMERCHSGKLTVSYHCKNTRRISQRQLYRERACEALRTIFWEADVGHKIRYTFDKTLNTFAETLDGDDAIEVEESMEERFQKEREAPTFDLPQHMDESIAGIKFARFPRLLSEDEDEDEVDFEFGSDIED